MASKNFVKNNSKNIHSGSTFNSQDAIRSKTKTQKLPSILPMSLNREKFKILNQLKDTVIEHTDLIMPTIAD